MFLDKMNNKQIIPGIFLGVFSCRLSVPFPMENNVLFPISIYLFFNFILGGGYFFISW